MDRWWSGTLLVAERGLLEKVRSKSFRVVMVLLVLVSAAFVTLPQVLAQEISTYTLATVGQAPPDLVLVLDEVGDVGEFEVEYLARDDDEDVERAVVTGEAAVGLAGDTLYTATQEAGIVVAQAVVTAETSRQLADAGLSPQQLADLGAIQPPTQVAVGAADEGRTTVGFAVGVTLFMALLFGGTAISTTVALEKSTRISEVLLAALHPSQILVGTVLAVGAVTVAQLVLLAAPVAVALQVTDTIELPAVATSDIVLAVIWFLLGFALYAFLYAALGALVSKVSEVDTVVGPMVGLITGAYFVAVFTVLELPGSPWAAFASMFPLTAPLAMPVRWISGEVPISQLLVAMALTAATALVFVALSSTIYRRALLITGHRVRFREVIGKPAVT
jgi:ABC-2 type transport system permease protein